MILIERSLAQKIVMAGSGLLMLCFVLGHMLGNTTIFGGPESLNGYAHHIQNLGPLLWLMRIIMLVVVLLHIFLGIKLTLENWQARPTRYAVTTYRRSTFSSRTMVYTGLIVLAFIVYHLLHFTFLVTNPAVSHLVDALGRHDVYFMVVKSFRNAGIVLAYVLALSALFLHLSHGISSLFQTMGLNTDRLLPKMETFGKGLALVLLVGFGLVPVAALIGVLALG